MGVDSALHRHDAVAGLAAPRSFGYTQGRRRAGRRRASVQQAEHLAPHRRACPRTGRHRRRQRETDPLRGLRATGARTKRGLRRAPADRAGPRRFRDGPSTRHQRSGAGRKGAGFGRDLLRRRSAATPRHGADSIGWLTDPDGCGRCRCPRGRHRGRRRHRGFESCCPPGSTSSRLLRSGAFRPTPFARDWA